ncbi:DEAD/DEAH box helicase [bacterium]|nr:DEAD/DEAH box helicase [bacterium]
MTAGPLLTREEIGEQYFKQLAYPPYPVQEEALLAWFMAEHGVLVCAPTGTGKTLVAHGALYESLIQGRRAYYTTPLIALTEQKFHELQESAVGWGFSADDVGLVTGNRRVNPDAKILVVVAEILLNRLLHPEKFAAEDAAAVVVDEFHSFNDPERGIVWELTLGLLPISCRLMLLSATVGNAAEFIVWLHRSHGRKLDLVRGTERKVPLAYQWVDHQLVGELLVDLAKGDEATRRTPALVFCFNREECWNVGEQFKGLDLLAPEQLTPLREEIERQTWDKGVGPKLRQMLWRGVGVHHAGLLPRYRRIVEKLFLNKCLPVVLCTETLSAGLNLPCRSVVLTELLKGPIGKKRTINPSVAHQIFGRAGRPQFDKEGFVYALAHEDDVKIIRFEEKLKTFPENPKDPAMIQAKKNFVKKKPTRREGQQYWTKQQFEKLIQAPPSHLASHGTIPWRLLAYLLRLSPEVDRLRTFISKRLLEAGQWERAQKELVRMLVVMHRAGFLVLDPPPPESGSSEISSAESPKPKSEPAKAPESAGGLFARAGMNTPGEASTARSAGKQSPPPGPPPYEPHHAIPTPLLDRMLGFRSIHPIYGSYLLGLLGKANEAELLQAIESVLTLPRPLLRSVRPPGPEFLTPGELETNHLDPELIARGLIIARPVDPSADADDELEEDYLPPPSFADKLRLLFDATYPGVRDVQTQPIWVAGEVILLGGDFDKYVRTYKLVKQEGIIFRHLLRLILLCGEFASQPPADADPVLWRTRLGSIARKLTECCRNVDAVSTARTIRHAHDGDFAESESTEKVSAVDPWESEWEKMLEELLPPEASEGSSTNDAD